MENYERLGDIVSYLQKKQRATTKELSNQFGVTEQTIRNDLSFLEKEEKVIRVHGGAKITENETKFDDRLTENVEEKRRLGKYAVTLVEEDDIIFLDGGTSILYLIECLPQDIHIKIITASLPIADKCTILDNAEIYCLGGMLNKKTKEMYGPKALEDISNLIANKAFIGISGFSLENQFTENNVLSLEVKRKILPTVSQSIIIADSKKENKIGIQRAFSFDEIDILITGTEVSKKFIEKANKSLKVMTI